MEQYGKLILHLSGGNQQEYLLEESTVVLGRGATCDITLSDARVSRSHAVIRVEGGRAVLVDLRSANGTRVNGRKISSAALRHGDRIVLADSVELIWEEGFGFGKRR